MGKRKHADFQKTKLKVGRQLPKGANVTDTSFKTKQIITPDQSFVPLADKPLTEILTHLNTKNVVQKLDTLGKIHTYIKEHKDTIHLYFSDILSKLGNAALESDPKVPELTVKVLTTCLQLLTDVQFKSFSRPMVLHLNCMMSHGAITVKQASLKVLEAILATHPKEVTRQPMILFSLLNMISTLKTKDRIRTLDDSVNSVVASYSWHQEVLTTVCLFLEAMLEPEDAGDEDPDVGVVYWDGKSELYVPLYAARGPVKVDLSWYANTTKPDDREVKKFVFELMDLLSAVVKGKIPRIARKHQDIVLPATDANYLNLIVQLLCYAGELARQHLKLEEKEMQKVKKQFQDIISLQLLNGFPYAQHGNVIASRNRKEGKEPDCIQLNAGICYLSAMFLLESDDLKLCTERQAVMDYISCVLLANSEMSDKTLLLFVKTGRILLKSEFVNLYNKNGVVSGLNSVLQHVKHSKIQSKMMYSFFFDISLDENYSDILSCDAMADWFKAVFQEFESVPQSRKIDVETLNYIKQMCCRKHPEFMQIVNAYHPETLIDLLYYDNEDYQITLIHLILAKDIITASFLNDLSNLICQNNAITLKMSTRLIYSLHTRYSSYGEHEIEKIFFVKFLINTACDTRSLYATGEDFKNADVMDILFSFLSNSHYRIYPTKKWKTHKGIFEVCLELLLSYRELRSVQKAVLVFARAFLSLDVRSIPVHVVLAFLLIRQKLGYLFRSNDVIDASYALMFSSFMYISVLVTDAKDQAKLYCIPELQECLVAFLEPNEVTRIIQRNQAVFLNLEENELFYTLKIIMFLMNRGKINTADPYMNNFLTDMCGIASHSPVLLPVWNKIFSSIRPYNTM